MNKNISIALHAVTILAVAVLYFLHFNCSQSCGPKMEATLPTATAPSVSDDEITEEATEAVTEMPDASANTSALAASGGVAYVNSDSLMSNFVYFQKVRKQLEAKRAKLESVIENKTQAMQKEYMGYQQRGASMTQKEMEDAERSLMTKQQELVQYRDGETEKLFTEEQKYNKELFIKVNSFLKDYAAQKGYSVILGYSEGQGAVLFGDKSLDITKEVLKGLNAREKK